MSITEHDAPLNDNLLHQTPTSVSTKEGTIIMGWYLGIFS